MTDWSEERPSADLVKQTCTLWDVADMLGLDITSQGKVTSPFNPDERTPSCQLHDDYFYDFSSGRGGDVIAFAQALTKAKFGDVVWQLWRKALKAGKEPGDVEKSEPRAIVDFTEHIEAERGDKYFSMPPKGENNPWDDLNPPVNCLWDWRPDNLLIPHQDLDGVYGVKVRHADGRKEAWPGSQFTKRLYDPWGWQLFHPGPVVITEGETDCWAMGWALDEMCQVLALPSGASSWKDHWLKDLEPFDKIWICTDNDAAGKAARDKLTSKIGYLRAEQLRVPPLYNDARAAITAGWRPELTVL